MISTIFILYCLGIFLVNYKPKMNDRTLMVNYFTHNQRKYGRRVFDATSYSDL